MKQPPLGWTTLVDFEYQQDGDTITVSTKREFVIRLLGDGFYFDTPETYHPKLPGEKEAGEAAKKYLYELLTKEVPVIEEEYYPTEDTDTEGNQTYYKRTVVRFKRVPRELVLHIPTDDRQRMRDVTALGRFNGLIFVDGIDVAEEMRKAGHLKRDSYE